MGADAGRIHYILVDGRIHHILVGRIHHVLALLLLEGRLMGLGYLKDKFYIHF